jgi:hypothetical protein
VSPQGLTAPSVTAAGGKWKGNAVSLGDIAALKSAIYELEDRSNGAARALKLWWKTGSPVDEDLRGLWLHEMRQQRVMALRVPASSWLMFWNSWKTLSSSASCWSELARRCRCDDGASVGTNG